MAVRRVFDHPGACHFVTFSTHQRRRLLDSPRTRDIVVEVLQKCLTTHGGYCAAFVIMPDHVHAILHGEADFRLSPFMQVWKKTCSYRLARFYAAKISHYRKTWPPHSPIWQARFYDFHIESDEKLNEKIDYIHHNPVVAGLAATIVDWPWSSARFYQLSEPVTVTP